MKSSLFPKVFPALRKGECPIVVVTMNPKGRLTVHAKSEALGDDKKVLSKIADIVEPAVAKTLDKFLGKLEKLARDKRRD